MKKFIAGFFSAAVICGAALGFAACSTEGKDALSFYMPDGAPALSAAYLMAEDVDLGREVNYNVVDASTIQTYVTGNALEADLCILPVNQAGQLLGSGERYSLLGEVTHGNLYIVSLTETEELTANNLSTLTGKKVGVVNLAAVPGLTLKVILNDNDLEFCEVGNDGEIDEGKVNLYAMSAASDVTAGLGYDYYVIPEPALSTLSKNTAIKCVGSLQTLYGGDNGYPQAVLVAKNSLIDEDSAFIFSLTEAMEKEGEWLLSADTSLVCEAVQSHLSAGLSPTFSEANLSETVMENCAISFVAAKDCKQEILTFLEKFSAVQGTTYSVADGFFYGA